MRFQAIALHSCSIFAISLVFRHKTVLSFIGTGDNYMKATHTIFILKARHLSVAAPVYFVVSMFISKFPIQTIESYFFPTFLHVIFISSLLTCFRKFNDLLCSKTLPLLHSEMYNYLLSMTRLRGMHCCPRNIAGPAG